MKRELHWHGNARIKTTYKFTIPSPMPPDLREWLDSNEMLTGFYRVLSHTEFSQGLIAFEEITDATIFRLSFDYPRFGV
jgi:hypothetical protein